MNGRFRCDMLDCIRNSEQQFKFLLDIYSTNYVEFLRNIDESITGITLVGSGSSSTCAITAKPLMQKYTGLDVTVLYPNDFIYNTYNYDTNRAYIFISQTGTSLVTMKALNKAKELGLKCFTMSESRSTKLATQCSTFIDMGCGKEEYPMRTTGYSSSVFCLLLLSIQLGKKLGVIDQDFEIELLNDARLMITQYQSVIDSTLEWLTFNKRKMLQSQLILFVGADQLYGIALEGAMKVWETPQIASQGYELEESLHGPNYGYNSNHCVIVLDDGLRETKKAHALAKYVKDVKHNGFIIGPKPIDQEDFTLISKSNYFYSLHYAACLQTIAYKLAKDQGRDLFAHHDNSLMYSYFETHNEN